MPAQDRQVNFPQQLVLNTSDLVRQYRNDLAGLTFSPACFEELVRQCLDLYLGWNGDQSKWDDLPELNNAIEIPELCGLAAQQAEGQLHLATHVFAKALYMRFVDTGVFLNGFADGSINYGFDRFLGSDIVLFHFPY